MADLTIDDQTKTELDEKLARLDRSKTRWARTPIEEKIEMCRKILKGTYAAAPAQVAAAVAAKQLDPNSPQAGEEWLGGPVVTLRNLRLLINSMEQVAASGKPKLLPGAIATRPDGQVVVKVFPDTKFDKLMYTGFEAHVWMEPELKTSDVAKSQAVFYGEKDPTGAVALVLGAGNVASIGPLDVIYKLFVEGQVCILKMNPVNDYLGEFIEQAFADCIKEGFLEMAYGGAGVGAYLCQHELVEEIHITGSDKTHDAIVYGVGKEGEKRKKKDDRVTDKRITSELGNVSPIVVIPGDWSEDDMRFQAENIATQLANNGGFNCNAARVVITHKEWKLRDRFVQILQDTMKSVPQRVAYYPGAEDRYDAFCTQNPDNAKVLGSGKKDGKIPWTIITDIDPTDEDNIVFTTEAFAGVMAETALSAPDVDTFIDDALSFCNDTVWGTLNAEVIVHPKSEKSHPDAVDRLIGGLKYGSVGINHWPALSYGLGCTTWGAFPGHTFQDIRSGIGVVHNTFMFDRPQKSVVRGPFRMKPKPPWFVTNKNTHNIAPRLAEFEVSPGILNFAKIAAASLKG